MIGQICSSRMPFFDVSTQSNGFKYRPALIIGEADIGGDYNALPISRVSNRANMDLKYDVEIDLAIYPLLQLDPSVISYVRTHKATFIHRAGIGSRRYGDMKADYPDLFLEIMAKWEEYNFQLIDKALL